MKRVVALLLCVILSLSCFPLGIFAVEETDNGGSTTPVEENVVFVADSAAEGGVGTVSAPFNSLYDGFEALAATGGTVVVMGLCSLNEGVNEIMPVTDKHITVTSYYGGVDYRSIPYGNDEVGARIEFRTGPATSFALHGDVTFDYINFSIPSTTKNALLTANFNDLTITENCATLFEEIDGTVWYDGAFDADLSARTYAPIVLTGENVQSGGNAILLDQEVNVYGGIWNSVRLGDRDNVSRNTYDGNVTVNIGGNTHLLQFTGSHVGNSLAVMCAVQVSTAKTFVADISINGGTIDGQLACFSYAGGVTPENQLHEGTVNMSITGGRFNRTFEGTDGVGNFIYMAQVPDGNTTSKGIVTEYGNTATVNLYIDPANITYGENKGLTVYGEEGVNCNLTLASSEGITAIDVTPVIEVGQVVYLNGTAGADTNDGKTTATAVATLERAIEVANTFAKTEEIYVVVTGETVMPEAQYVLPANITPIVVTSVHNGIDYRTQGATFATHDSNCAAIHFNGTFSFENVTVKTTNLNSILSLQYNCFTVGEGVEVITVKDSAKASSYPIILVGCNTQGGVPNDKAAVPTAFTNDVNIEVNSGTWAYIRGGDRDSMSTFDGNMTIDINGGEFLCAVTSATGHYTSGNINGATGKCSYGSNAKIVMNLNGGEMNSLVGCCYVPSTSGHTSAADITINIYDGFKLTNKFVAVQSANTVFNGDLTINIYGGDLSGLVESKLTNASSANGGTGTVTVNYNAYDAESAAAFKALKDVCLDDTGVYYGELEIENGPVAFVKDGGAGDGSAPDKAFGSMQDAYNALDLSKNCTIVICGPYTQIAHFDPWIEYEGKLTITSVYGGVDYRVTADAEYVVNAAFRFFLYGDTKFDNINVRLKGDFWFLIAQCNELYIGEGFEAVFEGNTDGSSFAKALSVVGGFQNGVGLVDSNLECDKDVNITILSGKYWVLTAYNRQSTANHSGKANVTLGGDADVNFLYHTSINRPGVKNGDVEITIKDNANLHYLLASPNDNDGLDPISVNSLTVNWIGGNIDTASLVDPTCANNPNFSTEPTAYFVNGTTLNHIAAVEKNASFDTIAALFDNVNRVGASDEDTDEPKIKAEGTCGAEGDNLTWKLYSNGELVISGAGAINEWETPKLVPWYTYIADITEITISDGVTSISAYTFYECYKCTSVYIPASVISIGDGAFYGCSKLEYIEIPESVVSIGNSAFAECAALDTIEVAEGNTAYTDIDGVLLTKDVKTLVVYPAAKTGAEYQIPTRVTSISNGAFRRCAHLESIRLPFGLVSVGQYAFLGCSNLTSVTVLSRYTELGASAFADCSPNLTIYGDSVSSAKDYADANNVNFMQIGGMPLAVFASGACGASGSNIIWTLYSNGKLEISGFRYMNNWSYPELLPWYKYRAYITEVEISEDILSICEYAFYEFKSLKNIKIPDSVTRINSKAFYNCTSLESITIPENVTIIEADSFNGCTALIKAAVYNKTAEFGADVFKNTSADFAIHGYLGSTAETYATENGHSFVELAERLVTASGTCGANGDNLTWTLYDDGELVISGTGKMKSYTSASAVPWYAKRSLIKSVVIEEGVTFISGFAFSVHTNLKTISIPVSVTSISSNFISGTSNLTSIEVAAENPAFCSVDGILFNSAKTTLVHYPAGKDGTSYAVPSTVTSIGSYAFSYAKKLTAITIPEGVLSISTYAFQSCSSVAQFDLPDSLKSIGAYAFSGCAKLTGMVIPKNVSSIGVAVFQNCKAITAFTVDAENTNYVIVDGVLFDINKTKLVAYPAAKADTQYTVPDTVTEITNYAFSYCANLTSVVLPDELAAIGIGAFMSCSSLESINLPSGLTTINNSLFSGCRALAEIVIPEGVTSIGSSAFSNCISLANVSLPSTLETIVSRAFYGCSSLTEISIPESVTSIASNAFQNCTALVKAEVLNESTTISTNVFANTHADFTLYGYAGSTAETYATKNGHNFVELAERLVTASGTCGANGDNLTWVLYDDGELVISGTGRMAAYTASKNAPWYANRTSIKSVVIEEGVTSIGAFAFNAHTNLKTISIPSSVTAITTTFIFGTSNLTSIDVAAENTVYCSVDGIMFNADKTKLERYPAGKEGTSYTVPSTVTSIGSYAFSYAKRLTAITIPEGVLSIASYAFQNCSLVAEFDLPDSLKSIGAYAFLGCTKLTGMVIPKNVSSIGAAAFRSCKAITSFTVDAENTHYVSVDDVLFNINKTTLVAYPLAKTDTQYIVPDTVTEIADSAFYGCVNPTDIKLPDELETIGNYAFQNCSALASINLPNTLSTIGHNTFAACKALTAIVIPEGVTTIEASAFHACTSLASVSLPGTLESISSRAFYGCTALTEISIPVSVTTISANAFENCTALSKAVVLNENVTINANVFKNTNDEFTLYGYAGSTAETYANANNHKFEVINTAIASGTCGAEGDNLTWYITDDGELVIEGAGAMADYSASSPAPWAEYAADITSVTVTKDVTYIGNNAFKGHADLERADVISKTAEFGKNVFEGVSEEFELYGYYDSPAVDYAAKNKLDIFFYEVPAHIPTRYYEEVEPKVVYVKDGGTGDGSSAASPLGTLDDALKAIAKTGGEIRLVGDVTLVANSVSTDGAYNYYTAPVCGYNITITTQETNNKANLIWTDDCQWFAISGSTTFENLKLVSKLTGGQSRILARGNHLTMGEGLEMYSGDTLQTTATLASAFSGFSLVGLSEAGAEYKGMLEDDSWITIKSGVYSSIFGKCHSVSGSAGVLTGNTYLELLGDFAVREIGATSWGNATQIHDNGEAYIVFNATVTGWRFFPGYNYVGNIPFTCNIFVLGGGFVDVVGDPLSLVGAAKIKTLNVWFDSDNAEATNLVQQFGSFNITQSGGSVNVDELKSYTGPAYRPTETNEVEAIISGICGEGGAKNLIWVLYEDGELGIYGNGSMNNFENAQGQPWRKFREMIERVGVREGVTSIGDYAFYGLNNLKNVDLPKGKAPTSTFSRISDANGNGIESIGQYAFGDCEAIEEIIIPVSVTTLGANAFSGCEALEKVTVLSTVVELPDAAIPESATIVAPKDSPAAEYAEETGREFVSIDIRFTSATLSLYNDISVHFKANKEAMDKVGFTEPYAVFEFNGKTYTVTDYKVERATVGGVETDVYVFRFNNLAPDKMNDTITATLYATVGGEEYASKSVNYSIATYCYNQLKKCTQKNALATVCVDLLNYGAETQKYTGHNVESLANANLTEAQKAWGTQEVRELTSVTDATGTPAVEGAKWKSAALKLRDNITVEMKFSAEDITGYYVEIEMRGKKIPVTEFGYDEAKGYYVVTFNDFSAIHMGEVINATVRNAQGDAVSKTLVYSVESYALSKKDDATIGDLVKAMIKYGDSAIAYNIDVRTVDIGMVTLVAAQTAAINNIATTSDTRVAKFEVSDEIAAILGDHESLSGNLLTVKTANIAKRDDIHINDYLGFTGRLILLDGVPCVAMDNVYVVDNYGGDVFSVQVNEELYDIKYNNAVYSNTLVYGENHNNVFVDATEGTLSTYGRILICDVGNDGLKSPESPLRYSDNPENGIKADICRFIPFNRVSAVYGFEMMYTGTNNAFKGVMKNDVLTMFYVPYYSQYYEAAVPNPAITLKAELPDSSKLIQLSAGISKRNGIYLGNGVTNGITDKTTAERAALESFSAATSMQGSDIYVAVNGNFVSGQVHIGNTTVIGNAIFVTVGDAVEQTSGKAVLNGTGDGAVILGDVTLPVGFNRIPSAVNGWYYDINDAAAAISANLDSEVEYIAVDGRVVYLNRYEYVAPITDPRTLDYLILVVDTNKNDVVLNDDGTITVPAYNLDTFEMDTVKIDKFDGVSVGLLVQQFGMSVAAQMIFGSDSDITDINTLVAALIASNDSPYVGFNGNEIYGVVAQLDVADGVFSVGTKDIHKLKSVVLGLRAGNNLLDNAGRVSLAFVRYSENAISSNRCFVGAFDELQSNVHGEPLYDFASEYLVVNSDTKLTVIGKDGIKSVTGLTPHTGDTILLAEDTNAVVLALSTEEIVIVNLDANCDEVLNFTEEVLGGGWYTLTWNTDYISMSSVTVDEVIYYNYVFENMLNLDTMAKETVTISSTVYYSDPAIAFFGDKWISGNGSSTVMDSTTVGSGGKPNTDAIKSMYDVYYIGRNLGDGIKKSSIYSWGLAHGWDVGVVRNIVAGDPNTLVIDNIRLTEVADTGYSVSAGDSNKNMFVVVSYSMIIMNQSINSKGDEFLNVSYDGNAGYHNKILANANDGGASELVLYKVDENGICTLFVNFCDGINARNTVITDAMAGVVEYVEEPKPIEPAEVNGGWYTLTWKTKYVSVSEEIVNDVVYYNYIFEEMLNLDTMETENVVISSTVYYPDPAIALFGDKWLSQNGSSTVIDSTVLNSSTKKFKGGVALQSDPTGATKVSSTANLKMYDIYFIGSELGDGIVLSSIYTWGLARGWNVGVVKSIVQPSLYTYVAADQHTLVIENAKLTCVDGAGYTVDLAGDDTLDVDVVISYSVFIMNQSRDSKADELKTISYSDTTGYQSKMTSAKSNELVLYKVDENGVCTVFVNFCDAFSASSTVISDALAK